MTKKKPLTQAEFSRRGVEARRKKLAAMTPEERSAIGRPGGLEAARRREVAEAAAKLKAKKDAAGSDG